MSRTQIELDTKPPPTAVRLSHRSPVVGTHKRTLLVCWLCHAAPTQMSAPLTQLRDQKTGNLLDRDSLEVLKDPVVFLFI